MLSKINLCISDGEIDCQLNSVYYEMIIVYYATHAQCLLVSLSYVFMQVNRDYQMIKQEH